MNRQKEARETHALALAWIGPGAAVFQPRHRWQLDARVRSRLAKRLCGNRKLRELRRRPRRP